MSSSTHQIVIKGKDSTAGAFRSIEARAAAAGSRISKIVGGAVAAAGAYLSVKAFTGAAQELGKLSDTAQRTGTNVGELTSAVTALQVLGVNASVESLAKSFQMMEKNTGRSGLSGFYQTVEELRAVPDIAKRNELAMKIFGRSGLELAPLLNSANDSVEAVEAVRAALGGVPQWAADAGDRAADAMTIASNNIKSIWYQVVATILNFFDGHFVGGLRGAVMKAGAYLEYFVKLAGRYAKGFSKNWASSFRDFAEAGVWAAESLVRFIGSMATTALGVLREMVVGTFKNLFTDEDIDMSFSAMFERAGGTAAMQTFKERLAGAVEMAGEHLAQVSTDDLERRLKERLDAVPKAAAAAEKGLPRDPREPQRIGEKIGDAAARKVAKISNELIMGGTNAATRLSLLGPQYQNEQKKQTGLLQKIADNTAKATESGGTTTYEATDL